MPTGSTISVRNISRGTCLGDAILVADSAISRFVGLLGRRSLDSGSGLLIYPSQGVHTMGMLFPIDIIFVDDKYRVVGLRDNLRPYRISAINFKAAGVLELPINTIRQSKTEIFDQLVWKENASLGDHQGST